MLTGKTDASPLVEYTELLRLTAREAAIILLGVANDLKHCYTINGVWPDDEQEVKNEFDDLVNLAMRLTDGEARKRHISS